jgi:hypothetical protein
VVYRPLPRTPALRASGGCCGGTSSMNDRNCSMFSPVTCNWLPTNVIREERDRVSLFSGQKETRTLHLLDKILVQSTHTSARRAGPLRSWNNSEMV